MEYLAIAAILIYLVGIYMLVRLRLYRERIEAISYLIRLNELDFEEVNRLYDKRLQILNEWGTMNDVYRKMHENLMYIDIKNMTYITSHFDKESQTYGNAIELILDRIAKRTAKIKDNLRLK